MFRKIFSLFSPEPDAGGGGGVTRDAALAYLSDFGIDTKSFEGVDDKEVLATHSRYVEAVGKHAPKPAAKNGGTWYDEFKDPTVKEWLKSYGQAYPDPEAVALKALNLEKFVGAEKAGRGVVLPKPDAKPEEWQAFFKKTGVVPEKVDGYKVPAELEKDPIVTKFREHAHKVNMPATLFDDTMKFMVGELKEIQTKEAQEFEQRAEKEFSEVVRGWGKDADKKQEAGRRAAAALIPHDKPEQLQEALTRMEGALGTKFTMELWARIGEAFSEHGFVDNNTGPDGKGMTPAGARIRIEELKKDVEWGKAFAAGDAEKKAEWERLHKIGYPEQK